MNNIQFYQLNSLTSNIQQCESVRFSINDFVNDKEALKVVKNTAKEKQKIGYKTNITSYSKKDGFKFVK